MRRITPHITPPHKPKKQMHAPHGLNAMESCHVVYGVASVAAMALPSLHMAATLAAGGIAVCIIVGKVME